MIDISKVRYYALFRDLQNAVWTCFICQEGYSGVAQEIKHTGGEPLTIEWSGDDKMDPIVKSRATLRVLSDADRRFIDLYTIGDFKTTLHVYKGDDLYWMGYQDSEQYEEPYSFEKNYIVELTFSDLAPLERVKYPYPAGLRSVKQIITDCLQYPFSVAGSWLKSAGLPGLPIDTSLATSWVRSYKPDWVLKTYTGAPLDLSDWLSVGDNAEDTVYVDCANWVSDDGTAMDCLEVLSECLRPFALRVEQRSGKYSIYDLNGLYKAKESNQLSACGTDAVLSADRIYSRAKVTVSPYEIRKLAESPEIPEKGDTVAGGHVYKLIDRPTFVSHEVVLYNTDPKIDLSGRRYKIIPGVEGDSTSGVLLLADNIYRMHCYINPGERYPKWHFVRRGYSLGVGDRAVIRTMSGYPGLWRIPGIPWPDGPGNAVPNPTFPPPRPVLRAEGGLPLRSREVMEDYLLGIKFEYFLSRSHEHLFVGKDRLRGQGLDDDFGACSWVLDVFAKDEKGKRIYRFKQLEEQSAYNKGANRLYGYWVPIDGGIGGIKVVSDKVECASWGSDFGDCASANLRGGYVCFMLPPVGVSFEVVLYDALWVGKDAVDVPSGGIALFGQLIVLRSVVNWYALRNLQVGLFRADGTRKDEAEDIQLQSWLAEEAAEEAPETKLLLSSAKRLSPISLALVRDEKGKRLSDTVKRGAAEGSLEELYLATMYSHYATRHLTLSGAYRPLNALKPVFEDGRRYLAVSETMDVKAQISDLKLVEINADIYEPNRIKADEV